VAAAGQPAAAWAGFGLVGLGRIGKAVAVRAATFGMRLLAYEPYPDQGFVTQYGVKLLDLDDLLARPILCRCTSP